MKIVSKFLVVTMVFLLLFTNMAFAFNDLSNQNYAVFSLEDIKVGKAKSVTLKDGSVLSVTCLKETPGTIVKGTGSFGSSYKDYLVKKTKGSASASFRASGWIGRYGNSTIDEVHSGSVSGFGSGSLPDLKIVRKESDENRNISALAEMRWQNTINVTAGWGPISGVVSAGNTNFLYLAIIGQNMYISDTYPNL